MAPGALVKFEFQNLGTIQKTTLDLRPLTVIIGPNNTNKTYLAYCVHGLIQSLTAGWSHAPSSRGKSEITLEIADVVARTQAKASFAATEFTEQLAEYFQDTYGGLFKETKLAVHLDEKDVLNALRILAAEANSDFEIVDHRVVLHVRTPGDKTKRNALENVTNQLLFPLQRETLTLPAERNAFVITYKMLSARRYRVLRDRQRAFGFRRPFAAHHEARERETAVLREQGDLRYPTPIEEFLDFLTDVEISASKPLNDAKSTFGKLAQLIETHIQAGHRTGYEATKLGGSELALTVSDQLRIDLYNASSSIKQLAPLLLYLRYRAAPGQTLIIDEPEMNLHPEGQAKLLEALGMLANLGVPVLLTTHSPYFLAHLNNLIASDQGSAARKKRQARHLYMGDPAAFLSPDDVSAYEMRPEGLVSLADPEYGIRWDTLSDVSAELQRRYFAIVEEPRGRAKGK